MTDQFHITASQMRALVELLGEIPALIDDLAITLTRQDCIGAGGMRVARGSDEQPLPLNLAASDAHDLLHSTLASWARHTEESRGHAYTGPRSALGLSTWLATNVTRLAMTEGCEEAHDEIEHAMGECRRTCDLHDDRAVLCVDPTLVPELEALELSATDCVKTAKTAGISLTKRRVDYLGEARPWIRLYKSDGGEWVYRLGDVLSANGTPLRRDLGREVGVIS